MNKYLKTFKITVYIFLLLLFLKIGFPDQVNADFTFAAAGDLGADSTGYVEVMRKLGELANPTRSDSVDFFILPGDISYGDIPNGYSTSPPENGWCQATKDYINIGSGRVKGNSFGELFPYEMVSGNHDDDYSGGLIDRFTEPQCLPNRFSNAVISPNYSGPAGTSNYGKEYYFNYPTTGTPLARFIQISPNLTFTNGGSYSYTSGTTKYNWLRDSIDSARSAGIPWVIVVMHQNCITSATKSCSISTDLMNLLISKDSQGRQRADLLIQGHDHTYQRSKQLSLGTGCTGISTSSTNTSCIVASGNAFSKGAGTVLVINGAGGNTLYTVNSADSENGYFQAWMGSTSGSESQPAGGNGTYGISKFTLTPTQLLGEFVAATGGTYSDFFTINSGPAPTATPTPTRIPTPTGVSTPTPTRVPTPTTTPATAKPGDANGDGQVNEADYDIWFAHYLDPNSTVPGNPNFNNDGRVDGIDYAIWINNYGGNIITPTPTHLPTPTPSGPTREILFQGSAEDFMNPERGFYNDIEFTGGGCSGCSSVRGNGFSLVRTYIRLDNYRTGPIPQSVIDGLKSYFNNVRQARIKSIARVTYNFNMSSPDASQSIISQHLSQVKPVMDEYQDVIYQWLAGFVGAWGEWHSSTNFNTGTDGNGADFATLGSVYQNILQTIPASRMSALRYPAFQRGFFGTAGISSANAFNGSAQSRSGYYNDCFLADTTDQGTFNVTGMSVQAVKDFISRDTKYVPMTGETCASGRVSCTTALSELSSMHWSALNNDFDTSALNILRNQGCYDEIHRRLGYRFVLKKVTLPSQINTGTPFTFHMELTNVGFAPMYNERPVYLVFENMSTGSRTPIKLTTANPRRWLPVRDLSLITINDTVNPSGLSVGLYRLYLWLPDASSTISNMPEYAVRFANLNTWRADTGYNYLTDNIEITSPTQ